MPKETLKQLLPTPSRMRKIKSLGFLGEAIYQPNLWHINRYSAAMAFFVGPFTAFLPIPGQMIIAALAALLLRCNLPLSVALVWLTNPVTMTPVYYTAYRIGTLLVGVDPVPQFEFSFQWFADSLEAIWLPMTVGCLTCGLLVGALGYFLMMMIWRIRVIRNWKKRQRLRANRAGPKRPNRGAVPAPATAKPHAGQDRSTPANTSTD